MKLPESARALIKSGANGHLTTLNSDGSPQVTIVWFGLDGDDLVAAHSFESKEVRNIRRDGRVAVTFESASERCLRGYFLICGTARIDEGGAP